MQELHAALHRMKRRKAMDDNGICAEFLKDAPECFLQLVLQLFNDVLFSSCAPPDVWRRTRLTVIYKKGDAESVSNYRPIAIISVLYKLFSRIICDRISKILLPQQSPEQAAYRPGFSTVDHLLSMTLLQEKSTE